MEKMRFEQVVRLVRGRAGEGPDKAGLAFGGRETQFLPKLPRQRLEGRLAEADLATRLHERACASFPDEEHATLVIVDQGGGDADEPGHEGTMSRPANVRNGQGRRRPSPRCATFGPEERQLDSLEQFVGLAIACAVADRHEGRLVLRNGAKGGLVAELRLPLTL